MKSMYWFILVLLLSFSLSACGNPKQAPESTPDVKGNVISVDGGQYTDITVAELKTLMANKEFVFVNVHIPYEGDIPGTDLSVPFNEIEQNLDQFPAEMDAMIVLYCQSDRMSTIAAETMVGLGYTNIWNLEGGMAAWEQAGLSLENR